MTSRPRYHLWSTILATRRRFWGDRPNYVSPFATRRHFPVAASLTSREGLVSQTSPHSAGAMVFIAYPQLSARALWSRTAFTPRRRLSLTATWLHNCHSDRSFLVIQRVPCFTSLISLRWRYIIRDEQRFCCLSGSLVGWHGIRHSHATFLHTRPPLRCRAFLDIQRVHCFTSLISLRWSYMIYAEQLFYCVSTAAERAWVQRALVEGTASIP